MHLMTILGPILVGLLSADHHLEVPKRKLQPALLFQSDAKIGTIAAYEGRVYAALASTDADSPSRIVTYALSKDGAQRLGAPMSIPGCVFQLGVLDRDIVIALLHGIRSSAPKVDGVTFEVAPLLALIDLKKRSLAPLSPYGGPFSISPDRSAIAFSSFGFMHGASCSNRYLSSGSIRGASTFTIARTADATFKRWLSAVPFSGRSVYADKPFWSSRGRRIGFVASHQDSAAEDFWTSKVLLGKPPPIDSGEWSTLRIVSYDDNKGTQIVDIPDEILHDAQIERMISIDDKSNAICFLAYNFEREPDGAEIGGVFRLYLKNGVIEPVFAGGGESRSYSYLTNTCQASPAGGHVALVLRHLIDNEKSSRDNLIVVDIESGKTIELLIGEDQGVDLGRFLDRTSCWIDEDQFVIAGERQVYRFDLSGFAGDEDRSTSRRAIR